MAETAGHKVVCEQSGIPEGTIFRCFCRSRTITPLPNRADPQPIHYFCVCRSKTSELHCPAYTLSEFPSHSHEQNRLITWGPWEGSKAVNLSEILTEQQPSAAETHLVAHADNQATISSKHSAKQTFHMCSRNTWSIKSPIPNSDMSKLGSVMSESYRKESAQIRGALLS